MNEQHVSGKWKEFKGEVRTMWGKITDDELEATKGDGEAISGLVQQRYGDKLDGIKARVSALLDRFEIRKDKFVEDTKEKLRH